MNNDSNRRLGRGLEALISNAPRPTPAAGTSAALPQTDEPNRIPIAQIVPNPFQPRREFRPQDLRELEESIRVSGLLQPITVRRAKSGTGYELAAGERRLRAVTQLGWTDIPANVRDFTDQELLAVALVENLQRADLNPIEEALGYQQLMSEFGLTQAAVSEIVGKDRSTIANMLRLLQLPQPIRTMVQSGSLSLGHARALLALPNEGEIIALAKMVISDGLSVREVEKRVRDRKPTPSGVSGIRTVSRVDHSKTASTPDSPEIRRLQEQLRKRLQTDTKIAINAAGRGAITINVYSADDLDRILDLILGAGRQSF